VPDSAAVAVAAAVVAAYATRLAQVPEAAEPVASRRPAWLLAQVLPVQHYWWLSSCRPEPP
jgi:hypothetical protein